MTNEEISIKLCEKHLFEGKKLFMDFLYMYNGGLLCNKRYFKWENGGRLYENDIVILYKRVYLASLQWETCTSTVDF